MCTFQPGNFTGWGSEGVIRNRLKKCLKVLPVGYLSKHRFNFFYEGSGLMTGNAAVRFTRHCLVEFCFTSTETVDLLGTGRPH